MTNGIADTLSEAHPFKVTCVYVVVRAFVFHTLSPSFFVKLGTFCGFTLGQKYSSWYSTVVCMRG